MPLNNGTVKCSVDEHLAHLILDDGDGYRPCRRIALTAAFTVVGFSSNTPVGTLPPAVGNGLMVIMAESCQMARERLPPPPPPPVDTTVDDLIYAARSAFQVQEAQNFVARKQARRDVKISKENVARSARASLSQSASTHCVMLGQFAAFVNLLLLKLLRLPDVLPRLKIQFSTKPPFVCAMQWTTPMSPRGRKRNRQDTNLVLSECCNGSSLIASAVRYLVPCNCLQ